VLEKSPRTRCTIPGVEFAAPHAPGGGPADRATVGFFRRPWGRRPVGWSVGRLGRAGGGGRGIWGGGLSGAAAANPSAAGRPDHLGRKRTCGAAGGARESGGVEFSRGHYHPRRLRYVKGEPGAVRVRPGVRFEGLRRAAIRRFGARPGTKRAELRPPGWGRRAAGDRISHGGPGRMRHGPAQVRGIIVGGTGGRGGFGGE